MTESAKKSTYVPPRCQDIRIRVSPEEHTQIKKDWGEKATTTTIRDFLLTGKMPRRAPVLHPKTLAQLSMIGNNINQIARAANRSMDGMEKSEVLAALSALRATIEKISKGTK